MPMGLSRRISWMKSQARGCRRFSDLSRRVYIERVSVRGARIIRSRRAGWGDAYPAFPLGAWECRGLLPAGSSLDPGGRPEFGQKHFDHQHPEGAAAEAGAACPQAFGTHFAGQPGRRVTAGLQGAAVKGAVAEQQFAERAAAELFQGQTGTFQGAACGHAAGEYPGLAVAAQIHFAHPALTAGGHVEGAAFVAAQALPALDQRGDAEAVMGQRGQPAGQRVLIEQPVAHAGSGDRVQLAGGEPAWRVGEGGVGHGRITTNRKRASLARTFTATRQVAGCNPGMMRLRPPRSHPAVLLRPTLQAHGRAHQALLLLLDLLEVVADAEDMLARRAL